MKKLFPFLVLMMLWQGLHAQNIFVTKPYVQIGKDVSPNNMQLLWLWLMQMQYGL